MSTNRDINVFLMRNIEFANKANDEDNLLAHAIYALVAIVGEAVLRMPEEKR